MSLVFRPHLLYTIFGAYPCTSKFKLNIRKRRKVLIGQFSNAWLAFKAIERLEKADLGDNRQNADELIRWFWDHRDGVIRGAWYPDMVIKDMANSHVLKLTPQAEGHATFGTLPDNSEVRLDRQLQRVGGILSTSPRISRALLDKKCPGRGLNVIN